MKINIEKSIHAPNNYIDIIFYRKNNKLEFKKKVQR